MRQLYLTVGLGAAAAATLSWVGVSDPVMSPIEKWSVAGSEMERTTEEAWSRCRVTADGANLRVAPSTEARILMQAERDWVFLCSAPEHGWRALILAEGRGYMSADLLREEKVTNESERDR